jgi:hypothetical protein
VEDLVFTAIPFELPETGGPVRIDARIHAAPYALGGYTIDLDTTTKTPGLPTQYETVRLYYADGVLSQDADADHDFSDEPLYADSDRDCISNQLFAQTGAGNLYQSAPQEASLSGRLSALDFQAGLISLDEITVQFSSFPWDNSVSTLQLSEQTVFMGDLAPNAWLLGQKVALTLYRLQDDNPANAAQFWVTSAQAVEENLIGVSSLLFASDNLSDRVELQWIISGNYTGLRLERWSLPGGWNMTLDWSEQLGAGLLTFSDPQVLAGQQYIYRLYGQPTDGPEVHLAEDYGMAAEFGAGTGSTGGPYYMTGILQSAADGVLRLAGLPEVSYDDATEWISPDGSEIDPLTAVPGSFVEVYSSSNGLSWQAVQVIVWSEPLNR